MDKALHTTAHVPASAAGEAAAGSAAAAHASERSFTYCVKVAPHYSGLICAHLPDFPGLVVLGRDHDEAKELALAALEQEIARLISEEQSIPRPRARGRLTISVRRFGG